MIEIKHKRQICIDIQNELNKTSISYCFVSEEFDSLRDIDIIITRKTNKLTAKIVINIFNSYNFYLVRIVRRSSMLQLYFISKSSSEIINVDIMHEFSFWGIPYLGDVFESLLEIGNQPELEKQKNNLIRSYKLHRALLQRGKIVMNDFLSVAHEDTINLQRKYNRQFFFNIPFEKIIKGRFVLSSFIKNPYYSTRGLCENFVRKIFKFFLQRPLTLSVLGPDGAGKTFAISKFLEMRGVIKIEYKYLFPGFFKRYDASRTNTGINYNPHSRSIYSTLFSFLKLVVFWFEYFLGSIKVVFANKDSEFVVYDRHFADMAVDMKRYRLKLPRQLIFLALSANFKTDITIILSGDPVAINVRKKEIPVFETIKQVKLYEDLTNHLKNSFIIKNDDDLKKFEKIVRHEFLEIINQVLVARL